MNKLPNPNDFKTFKMELAKSIKFDDVVDYDLSQIISQLQPLPKAQISKIIDVEILKSNPNTIEILKQFVKWNDYYKSVVIVLQDVTVAIHRADGIKWKTYGSKKFIQHKIKDNFIFVVYGMAEILLCEILELSYIAFQSDSIVKTLETNEQWQNEIKPNLNGKNIFLLLDNDESCEATIKPIEKELKRVFPISMMDLHIMEIAFLYGGTLKKELPKGYDFRDWCNDVKDVAKIENILKETIRGIL